MHHTTIQPVDSVKRDLFSLENWLLSIYFGLTQFLFCVHAQNSIFMRLPRMKKKKNEYVSTGNTRICREGNELNIVWEFEWLIKNFSKSNGLMKTVCLLNRNSANFCNSTRHGISWERLNYFNEIRLNLYGKHIYIASHVFKVHANFPSNKIVVFKMKIISWIQRKYDEWVIYARSIRTNERLNKFTYTKIAIEYNR